MPISVAARKGVSAVAAEAAEHRVILTSLGRPVAVVDAAERLDEDIRTMRKAARVGGGRRGRQGRWPLDAPRSGSRLPFAGPGRRGRQGASGPAAQPVSRGAQFPDDQAEVVFLDLFVEQLEALAPGERLKVLADVIALCRNHPGKHPLSAPLSGWNTLAVLAGHRRVVYRGSITGGCRHHRSALSRPPSRLRGL